MKFFFSIFPLFSLLTVTFLSQAQVMEKISITGNYQDTNLSNIFYDIENVYPVQFFYKKEWIKDMRLSIVFQEESILDVIQKLTKPYNLNFLIYYNSIIIAPEDILNQDYTREYFVIRNRQKNLFKSNNWITASDIIHLGDSTKEISAGQVVIKGVIVDQLNEEPLRGVNLHFEALNMTTSTDNAGKFEILLPTGYNLVEISYIGYETQKIVWEVSGQEEIRILLAPDAYELEELLITGETDDNNVQSVMMGITRLRPQQIENLPVFLGEADVIKSLMTLPGVSTVGEGAGGFNVRGGAIDQNLILQDEALIFNASHALGFFSIFNSDAIQEVELYKGHIPAQYGGRLSSVLNVKLKGNNGDKLTGKGGIGIVASRLTLDGPLQSKKSKKNGNTPRTTFLLGGRITYSDWILKMIKDPDIQNSSGYFYDINAKISHRYSGKGMITASYYQSYDKVQFSDDYGFSWKNRAASLMWNHMIKPTISSAFSASMGDNTNLSYEPNGLKAFTLTNGLANFRLKEDILISSIKNHNLSTGIEYVRYDIFPDELAPKGDQSRVVSESIAKDNGQELGLYINDEFTLNYLFSFSFGLRFNAFQQLGPGTEYIYPEGEPKRKDTVIDSISYSSGEAVETYYNLMPRFSMKYSLSPSSSIKFSYNRTSQFIHLVSNSTAALPVDFWLVSGPHYAPETSNNFSIGYFRNFMNNLWETSLEIYYRRLQNVIEYKDFAELLLNDHLETDLLSGDGKAYGAEVLIRRKKGRFNGWLAYTYSRSYVRIDGDNEEETINDGEWYPSNLDMPHNFNVVFNYNFNKSSIFSLNFTYRSGRPITVPGSFYMVDGVFIPEFTGRNEFRIPPYHRLDLSYTLKRNVIRKKRYKDSFTFSIYNLYARENTYSIFYRKSLTTGRNAYRLSVLGTIFPSFTYNFEF